MELAWIKTINTEELDKIVEIHLEALSDSFLNNFGAGFLRKMYEVLVSDPNTLTLIARHKGKVVGYLVVILNQGGLFRKILFRDLLGKARIATDVLVRKPRVLFRALGILSLLKSTRQEATVELQFIAVSREMRGKGLGTEFLKTLTRTLRGRGVDRYVVGTKEANTRSNNFYLKNGFEFISKVRVFGDVLCYYVSPGHTLKRRHRRRSRGGTGGS